MLMETVQVQARCQRPSESIDCSSYLKYVSSFSCQHTANPPPPPNTG